MRPTYHFAPAKNWMNDPNGTVYDDGLYHLFYQYNPQGAEWGNICWAYATSPDLINWTRKGLKLTPENERYCFSGCALRHGAGMKLLYTSIGFEPDAVQHGAIQRFCDADAKFERIERTGRLTKDAHPFDVAEWRDPFVFSYRGKTYMTLAGVCGGESAILLYEASDATLDNWSYVGILYSETDDVLECPNVVFFGDTMALLYSSAGEQRVKYVTGKFDGKTLAVARGGCVDGGNAFYASNLSSSAGGETVLYGWLKETLTVPSPDGTYSGCLALPRLLRPGRDGALEFEPVPAISKLYKRMLLCCDSTEGAVLEGDTPRARITFTAGDFRMRVMDADDEYVELARYGGELTVTPVCERQDTVCATLAADIGEGLCRFDVFTDGSVFEIFAGSRTVLSGRFYGERRERVFDLLEGTLENLTVYELAPAEIKE